ncbi:secreted RxLR effector protein 161-like [Teleopsis dalmanni]|uniref:secreted RxLR effector protein 161-like n=1 Tax=Teleopsis dalmanni TaxID=139649 RepID=UPI0018CF1199|nr:secreted RxLR effector protein 161-like [Teleopsis dalmanni]
METCKPVSTPLDEDFKVIHGAGKKANKCRHQTLIGELMYLAVSNRPDIIHSVSKLSQVNAEPEVEHKKAAKHILRYLSKTIDLKLHYKSDGGDAHGYVDANWGSNPIDRKSYSRYVFKLRGSPISWESKKQGVTALSTTKAVI